MMTESKWFQQIRGLSYAQIRADGLVSPPPVESVVDHYIWIRAHIGLGRFDDAAALTEAAASHACFAGFATLLRAQLAAFRFEPSLEKHATAIFEIQDRLPDSSYVRGEVIATLGFLCNQQNDFKQGIPFHERALQHYAQAGLPNHQAISLFNLSVCANHLGQRRLYAEASRQIEELALARPEPFLRMLAAKLAAYRALDLEDWVVARRELGAALSRAVTLNRRMDQRMLLVQLAYVELKEQKHSCFAATLDRLEALSSERDGIAEVAAAFRELSTIGLMDPKVAHRLLRKWKASGIEGIGMVFLMDSLLEGLAESGHYESLASLARVCRALAETKQQAIRLVDFRYYEILALARLGAFAKLAPVLSSYLADARACGSERKAEKVREFVTPPKTASAKPVASAVVLDLDKQLLTSGDARVELGRKPTLELLFKILIEAERPLEMHKLHEAIYQTPYHPDRHEGRLNSLIERARKELPVIQRRDGRISLLPTVKGVVLRAEEETPVSRRQLLLKHIREKGGEVRVSELELVFTFSRRTLQADLAELTRANAIVRTGTKRGTSYRAGEAV